MEVDAKGNKRKRLTHVHVPGPPKQKKGGGDGRTQPQALGRARQRQLGTDIDIGLIKPILIPIPVIGYATSINYTDLSNYWSNPNGQDNDFVNPVMKTLNASIIRRHQAAIQGHNIIKAVMKGKTNRDTVVSKPENRVKKYQLLLQWASLQELTEELGNRGRSLSGDTSTCSET